MTSQSWLLIGVIIAMVVLTQLGWRKFTRRNVIQPFVIVGIVGFEFLRSIPTGLQDILVMLVCTAIGVAFGILMILVVRVRPETNGAVYIWSGGMYFLLWVVALGIRVLLAYGAMYWFPRQFYHFMISNHLSFSVIAPAFIFMTVAMILVRSIGTILKVRTARRNCVAPGL